MNNDNESVVRRKNSVPSRTKAQFSAGDTQESSSGTVRVPMLIEILKTVLGALRFAFRARAVLAPK